MWGAGIVRSPRDLRGKESSRDKSGKKRRMEEREWISNRKTESVFGLYRGGCVRGEMGNEAFKAI